MVFLGTPHRGTEAAKWGELVAKAGRSLNFGSDEGIMKHLKEDSETLCDLLYNFTLWLFRDSVPVVCFFELEKTDYGAKHGISWKHMVSHLSDLGSLSVLII